MNIIAAYEQVGTYRGAAALCGTTHKTVRRLRGRGLHTHEGVGGAAGSDGPHTHRSVDAYGGGPDRLRRRVAARTACGGPRRLDVDATGEVGERDRESGDYFPTGQPYYRSVWYRWRAPESGTAVFTTASSAIPTSLAVYTGTSLGSLAPVTAGGIDHGDGLQVSFAATAGTTYHVAVDGAHRLVCMGA